MPLLRIVSLTAAPLAALLAVQEWTSGVAGALLSVAALLLAGLLARAAASEALALLPHVGLQLESTSLWCVRGAALRCTRQRG